MNKSKKLLLIYLIIFMLSIFILPKAIFAQSSADNQQNANQTNTTNSTNSTNPLPGTVVTGSNDPTAAEHRSLSTQLRKNNFIKEAWKYVLALLNAVVVLGLIFIALANMLRINVETYEIRRMLPAIIIGVILANFSYLICRVMVDFTQVLADFFIKGVTGQDLLVVFGFADLAPGDTAPTVGTMLKVLMAFNIGGGVITGVATGGLGGALFIIGGAFLIIGVPFLLILFIGLLLAVRIYMIWALVILSPIAFFGLFFTPITKFTWQTWWSMFVRWIFFAPFSFVFIKLATIVAKSSWPEGSGPGFAKWFFGVVLFALAIYIPYMLGGKIVSGWTGLWKSAARYGAIGLDKGRKGVGAWVTGRYKDENRWQNKFGKALMFSPSVVWADRVKQSQKDVELATRTGPLRSIGGKRSLTETRIGFGEAMAGKDLALSESIFTAAPTRNPNVNRSGIDEYIQNKAANPKYQLAGDDAILIAGESWIGEAKRQAQQGEANAQTLMWRHFNNAGVDLNNPLTKQQEKNQFLKEAKESYDAGYKRTQSVAGTVIGQVEPPPGGGPIAGGPGGPEGPSTLPNFNKELEISEPLRVHLQPEIDSGRLKLSDVRAAIRELENPLAGDSSFVMNRAFSFVQRYTPTEKVEIGHLKGNREELLKHLQNMESLGRAIKDNPGVTPEVIKQKHLINLTQDWDVGQIHDTISGATQGKTPEGIRAALNEDTLKVPLKQKVLTYLTTS